MIRDRSASVIRCLRPHPGRLPSPSMPMALNWCSQRHVTLNTSDGLEHLPDSQVLAAAVRPERVAMARTNDRSAVIASAIASP